MGRSLDIDGKQGSLWRYVAQWQIPEHRGLEGNLGSLLSSLPINWRKKYGSGQMSEENLHFIARLCLSRYLYVVN
jgi:hypothetical protein